MKLFIKILRTGMIIACLFLTNHPLRAQSAKVIRVKNGHDATKSISAKDRFEFPEFLYGRLYYNNGKYAVSKLNYCYLLGEIMFINVNGDTLAIADNNQVSYVDIANSRFYPFPENGYVEVLEDCGNMLLTKKTQYQKDGIEKKGAYQNANDVGSIYNASTFTDINGRTTTLPANNTILLKTTTTYLVMDNNHRFSKANKTSLLKIFSKNKNTVERFLDEQNIDYHNEEDLKKAVCFCSAL